MQCLFNTSRHMHTKTRRGTRGRSPACGLWGRLKLRLGGRQCAEVAEGFLVAVGGGLAIQERIGGNVQRDGDFLTAVVVDSLGVGYQARGGVLDGALVICTVGRIFVIFKKSEISSAK